jgi:hypothetical protein
MAVPTFISEAETSWITNPSGTFKSAAFAALVGDVAVCPILYSAGNGSTAFSVERANTTWIKQQEIHLSKFSNANLWTGAVTGASTSETKVKVSGTDEFSGVNDWGHNTLLFRDSEGIGATGQAHGEGAPLLKLLTTQAHSAIVMAVVDYAAKSGTSRTWRTVNGITPTEANGLEKSYANPTGEYTVYIAYINDSGPVAELSLGLSAPSNMTYSIVAAEVLGTKEEEPEEEEPAAVTPVQLASLGVG